MTLKRKRHIHTRPLTDFPGGADIQASKVLPSQVSACLATYKFGVPSHNHYNADAMMLAFAYVTFDGFYGHRADGNPPPPIRLALPPKMRPPTRRKP